VADALLEAFPTPKEEIWRRTDIQYEKKISTSFEQSIPSPIRNMLYVLNSATFLRFLETLTGIEGLLPDPYFIGGGMHQIEPGGKLGVHIDFNRYPKFSLDRRLNLLLYLNKDWKEDYGGHFEMWDKPGKACVKKVLPIFNRCVIFSTGEYSWHGHPVPLTCPPDRTRKSIALYYYSNGRPKEERGHTHGTEFLEAGAAGLGSRLRGTAKFFLEQALPPGIRQLGRSLRGKSRRGK
jgi:Rps23 Pro-64 3,4-dihydroxylase Tpa1-like proline 4-hydroxylase